MSKTYRYRDLLFPVADNTDVYFTVEFISDGNSGQTLINVPGSLDPEIENSGAAFIGKGKDLRGEPTICVSTIANLVPEEDEIRIRYKINGIQLVEHSNAKSEEKNPTIILFVNFTAL